MAQDLKHSAFFCNNRDWTGGALAWVYADGRREEVESLTRCFPEVVSAETFEELAPRLQDLEVIFSTWGMPQLTEQQLERLPQLRAVFYAAGTVQGFARPFLQRDITVCSAWAANAVPVAEFTLAQILLANKGYFRNTRDYLGPQQYRSAFRGRGNFGATVALLGAGQIGRKVIELLRPFHLNVIVFDPFLSEADATSLGVTKVSLEEAFRQGYVVSNHLANLPATVKMLQGKHFALMPANATFINTGRGQTVDEDEMVEALQARPDITALLDVTDPEPSVAGSLLYELPNVSLTTHIAGSTGDEVVRMADTMIEEFKAWRDGRELRYSVSLEQLETMA